MKTALIKKLAKNEYMQNMALDDIKPNKTKKPFQRLFYNTPKIKNSEPKIVKRDLELADQRESEYYPGYRGQMHPCETTFKQQ
jgi:hypothetical protein